MKPICQDGPPTAQAASNGDGKDGFRALQAAHRPLSVYPQHSIPISGGLSSVYLEIMAKVKCLASPQAALISNRVLFVSKENERQKSGQLKLVFVGADFFRKGGIGDAKMVNHLLSKGFPLHLDIVSAMNFGDYASQTTQADLDAALAIVRRYPQHHVAQAPSQPKCP